MDQPRPQPNTEPRRLYCRRCGYNVGPTADWTPGRLSACPECGAAFDADRLAREDTPRPIDGMTLVGHMIWPPAIVFFASLIPVLSLITMPIAVLTLLIVTGFKDKGIAERIAYSRPGHNDKSNRDTAAGIAVLLWFAQAGLMALAAFGGCSLALSGMAI